MRSWVPPPEPTPQARSNGTHCLATALTVTHGSQQASGNGDGRRALVAVERLALSARRHASRVATTRMSTGDRASVASSASSQSAISSAVTRSRA